MGAVLVQQPDLFRAVVSHVGIYDMLRVELSPNGAFNVTEFGSVKDEAQFRALLAYSPYHHVVDGTPYPAVLLLTGLHDGRVEPHNSLKMAARLQEATSSGGRYCCGSLPMPVMVLGWRWLRRSRRRPMSKPSCLRRSEFANRSLARRARSDSLRLAGPHRSTSLANDCQAAGSNFTADRNPWGFPAAHQRTTVCCAGCNVNRRAVGVGIRGSCHRLASAFSDEFASAAHQTDWQVPK